MSRPKCRNNLVGRLGYKTQKLYPSADQSLARLSIGRSPVLGTASWWDTSWRLSPHGDRQLSSLTECECTPATSHQLAEIGILRFKSCSLHKDFCVLTRFYRRWIRISEPFLSYFYKIFFSFFKFVWIHKTGEVSDLIINNNINK